MAKVTSIGFERRYSDDSGVEFGVYLGSREITLSHISNVDFPVEEIDWLISCLQKIKSEIEEA